jgi:hypothetical protein
MRKIWLVMLGSDGVERSTVIAQHRTSTLKYGVGVDD